jgi:hypothetical protein
MKWKMQPLIGYCRKSRPKRASRRNGKLSKFKAYASPVTMAGPFEETSLRWLRNLKSRDPLSINAAEMSRTIRRIWEGVEVTLGMDEAGGGPSVVLLPALSSIATRAEMRPLFDGLATDFSVSTADWPGFGNLPRPRVDWKPDLLSAFLKWFLSEIVPPPIRSSRPDLPLPMRSSRQSAMPARSRALFSSLRLGVDHSRRCWAASAPGLRMCAVPSICQGLARFSTVDAIGAHLGSRLAEAVLCSKHHLCRASFRGAGQLMLCVVSILFHGNHHERRCARPQMMKGIPAEILSAKN